MALIHLTKDDDTDVWVNPAHIVQLDHNFNHVRIALSTENNVFVKDTVNQIRKKIRGEEVYRGKTTS